MALPDRHPEHDEWKAHSIKLAAELRDLRALLIEFRQHRGDSNLGWFDDWTRRVYALDLADNLDNQSARRRLEIAAIDLGGYGIENVDQFLRGDFSSASPEDVKHLRNALQGI